MADDVTLMKHVFRAICDLRRGFGIMLSHAGKQLWIEPAESWALESDSAHHRLILTTNQLSHSDNSQRYIAIEAGNKEALQSCMNASQLPQDVTIVEMDPIIMEVAIRLVKAAGWRPLVVVAAETSPQSDTLEILAEDALSILNQPAKLIETTPAPVTLPTNYAADCTIRAFRDQHSGITHMALVVGAPNSVTAPLCRVHSSCITGDILGSLRCDCGDQLHAALEQISQAGAGILLYLDQEGRGIGIGHKLHAYHLQDQGLDTVDANETLGFEADERDFRIAADMLKQLGITNISLLTNNPKKAESLAESGIQVAKTLPLKTKPNAHNVDYLETKRKRLGHI